MIERITGFVNIIIISFVARFTHGFFSQVSDLFGSPVNILIDFGVPLMFIILLGINFMKIIGGGSQNENTY